MLRWFCPALLVACGSAPSPFTPEESDGGRAVHPLTGGSGGAPGAGGATATGGATAQAAGGAVGTGGTDSAGGANSGHLPAFRGCRSFPAQVGLQPSGGTVDCSVECTNDGSPGPHPTPVPLHCSTGCGSAVMLAFDVSGCAPPGSAPDPAYAYDIATTCGPHTVGPKGRAFTCCCE